MGQRAAIRTILAAGVAVGATAWATAPAQAGGFFVHEQSTVYQGASFAGVAAGGGVASAMFWNPATITQLGPGLTDETDMTVIFPRSDIVPLSATTGTGASILGVGGTGNIGTEAFVPASYYAYGLTDRVWLGLALNSPFGFNTKSGPLWPGMFYGQESDVFSLNATPTIGFKINDWISVGAGVQVQYFKVKLVSAFPGSGTFPPFGSLVPDSLFLRGDSTGFGFTAGVTITPTPTTQIGLGYRSQIDQDIDNGHVYRPAFLTPTPLGLLSIPTALVGISATIPLPDVATASIRQRVGDSWTLMGTVEWTNWSRLGVVPITPNTTLVPPGIPTALGFNWRDGWLVSVGAEYQFRPNMILRAGVGFERSPIDDSNRSVRLPDNDRIWLSAGATYHWNTQLSIDIAYSHLFMDDGAINIVPGNPAFVPALGTFTGTSDGQVDIFSVALRYKFLPPPPAAPLITKG